MKIRMLETALGADDGFTVRTYEAGVEYDVSEALAREFLGAKQAEAANPHPLDHDANGRKGGSRKRKS